MSNSDSDLSDDNIYFDNEEPIYNGELKNNLYHGKGSLTFPLSKVIFNGLFDNGERKGYGEMIFPDGTCLKGNWNENGLHGKGECINPDGGKMRSDYWVNGSIEGETFEYDEDGILAWKGEYKDGIRNGKGIMYFIEGSSIHGIWENGLLSNKPAKYYYPDNSILSGIWEDGVMISAKYSRNNNEGKIIYKEDISTSTCISSTPLQSDPYEENYVYVDKSTIEHAGEGLFAKIDLEDNFICSFYNGIRLTHEEVDNRDWIYNSNTISLDEDTVIDVPKQYNNISVYKVTLGHKANHHVEPNAKYDKYFCHPIFGKIKCIRTIKPIKKGEEIFVDYGYKIGEEPEWYSQLRKRKSNNYKDTNIKKKQKIN